MAVCVWSYAFRQATAWRSWSSDYLMSLPRLSPPSGGPCALPSPASREPPSPSPDPQQAARVSMAEPGAPRWPARDAVPDTAPHRVGAAAARFRAGRVQVGAATAEVGLAVGLCGGLVRRRAHSNRALREKPARACCARDGAMAKPRPKTITGLSTALRRFRRNRIGGACL